MKPTSRETGIMAVVLIVIVASVITWDLTHQSLSAKGVEAPEGASGADGWLATLDNTSEFGAVLKLYDLSELDEDGIEVIQPDLSVESIYHISGDKLVMANDTELYVIDVSLPHEIYYQKSINGVEQIEMCDLGEYYVLLLSLIHI